MSTLNSLKQTLRPLGLYNLDDTTLINAELSAYALVLDEVEALLAELEQERFVVTAEDYGLAMRERILGAEQKDKTVEARRNLLLLRQSITSNDFNKTSLEKVLKNSGIIGYIIESPMNNLIYINCLDLEDSIADKEALKAVVAEFLPAHLECIFDFRNLQWNSIDSKNISFDEMDEKGLTWDDIDNFEEI